MAGGSSGGREPTPMREEACRLAAARREEEGSGEIQMPSWSQIMLEITLCAQIFP